MANQQFINKLRKMYSRKINESSADSQGAVHLAIRDLDSRDEVYSEITSWIAENEPVGRGYAFYCRGKYICMVSAADKNQLGFLQLLKSKGMCRWTRCSSGHFYFEEDSETTWFLIGGAIYKTTD